MVVTSFSAAPAPTPTPTPAPPVLPLTPAPAMTSLSPPSTALTLVSTTAVTAVPAPTSSSNNIPESLVYKSLLHQHIQKESLPAAIYQTLNEGSVHLPKFRSTVMIGGEHFTSPNVFSRRKEAEHDAAKIALEYLGKKIKEEEVNPIDEGTLFCFFCKSILNEYATKRQLERPVYNTIPVPGPLQMFVSSLVFNGVTYTGKNARTKKEAEQLAARAVILALIGSGDLTSCTIIYEIIKSKRKLYGALQNSIDFQNAESRTAMSNDNVSITTTISQGAPEMHPQYAFGVPTREAAQEGIKHVAEALQNDGMQSPIAVLPTAVNQSPVIPHHAFSVQTGEAVQQRVELPITFVPAIVGESANAGPTSGKRRRKNKKKAQKKMRLES